MHPAQYLIGVAAGTLVGFLLGVVAGGGSILALPLMVYAVGVRDPHLAVGTSALAVAANAAINAVNHARAGAVRWRVAAVFAAAGVAGAWCGSLAGKALPGERLLACFALLMLAVGVLMLRRATAPAAVPGGGRGSPSLPRLIGLGLAVGALSGFFGIGGGFLIVPGLVYAARLPMLEAVASSLPAVTAFSLTTALNYARSGWVDWPLAVAFAGGGACGGALGAHLARRLAARRGALGVLFGVVLLLVAGYMLYRSAVGLRPAVTR